MSTTGPAWLKPPAGTGITAGAPRPQHALTLPSPPSDSDVDTRGDVFNDQGSPWFMAINTPNSGIDYGLDCVNNDASMPCGVQNGVVGSPSRNYSASGGAFTLAFFDALAYEHQSIGKLHEFLVVRIVQRLRVDLVKLLQHPLEVSGVVVEDSANVLATALIQVSV